MGRFTCSAHDVGINGKFYPFVKKLSRWERGQFSHEEGVQDDLGHPLAVGIKKFSLGVPWIA